jgi:N-acetylmuramoyl-L-alanine amidase
MKTIVIDPGHGGEDYGAVYGTRYEKNDNLRLGLALRDKLQQYGQRVIMTRSTDVYVPLLERSIISNSNNADAFISLHRNSSLNLAANGVQNFVQTGSAPINTAYAKNVLDNVVSVGVQSNRGVSQDNFSVLRNTYAPAQLLELGFVSNDVDNRLFDQNFDAYVDAIARGLLTSLGEPIMPIPPASPTPPTGYNQTIKTVQQVLNERYGTGLAADGYLGPNTKKALVKGLQTELNRQYGAGLSVDGVFGAKTKAKIPNLKTGARGNLTWLLQAALYARGYNVSPVDGIFGQNTELMVKRFQADNGLAADGVAGPNTFEKLFKT